MFPPDAFRSFWLIGLQISKSYRDVKFSKIHLLFEKGWCMTKNKMFKLKLLKELNNVAIDRRWDLSLMRLRDKTDDNIKQQQQQWILSAT